MPAYRDDEVQVEVQVADSDDEEATLQSELAKAAGVRDAKQKLEALKKKAGEQHGRCDEAYRRCGRNKWVSDVAAGWGSQ